MNPAAKYTLARNIDMSELAPAYGMWNTSMGFVPIGNNTARFTGSLDGLGHTITGLRINRPAMDYVGLFGYISPGSTIRNVGLENSNIAGKNRVGGLAGMNNGGSISNSFNKGVLSGITYVGGLVGYNYGAISSSYNGSAVSGTSYVGGLTGMNCVRSISNSYSTGTVSGNTYVGGLAGMNYDGSISNSYSTGAVSGSTVGGLIGWNTGAISSSYWDTQKSGISKGCGFGPCTGANGRTTAQMMQRATYVGWDFTNVWKIQEGATYPQLQWQASN